MIVKTCSPYHVPQPQPAPRRHHHALVKILEPILASFIPPHARLLVPRFELVRNAGADRVVRRLVVHARCHFLRSNWLKRYSSRVVQPPVTAVSMPVPP